MFARRLFAVPAMTAVASTRRFKADQHEDDRWLEAEIDEHTKEMTNEERYAAEKQRELMKKLMGKMRERTTESVAKVEDKHAAEIAALKERLAALEGKK